MFHKEQERPYGCFSQWYAVPDGGFTFEGDRYFCAEQAMMAGKARLFNDRQALSEILSERQSSRRIKELGRAVKGFDPRLWSGAAFHIVKAANLAKFPQNQRPKEVLLSTAPALIAEAVPWDAMWGTGLAATHPDARCPELWPGANLLGYALMQVRDDLAS